MTSWKYNEAIANARPPPIYKGIFTTLGSICRNASGSASTPYKNSVVYKGLALICEG